MDIADAVPGPAPLILAPALRLIRPLFSEPVQDPLVPWAVPEPPPPQQTEVPARVRRAVAALTAAYPGVMKSAGIPGKVSMQFVVNTDGRVDPGTIKVMSSTHKAFEEPARSVITSPACTFKTGTSRGQPVRVLVQQAVSFKLAQ